MTDLARPRANRSPAVPGALSALGAVVCAILERTAVTALELQRRFGPRAASIVVALTQDPTIETYEERKAALRRQAIAAGSDARPVFAADKISKVRELRAQWARCAGEIAGDASDGWQHGTRWLGNVRVATA